MNASLVVIMSHVCRMFVSHYQTRPVREHIAPAGVRLASERVPTTRPPSGPSTRAPSAAVGVHDLGSRTQAALAWPYGEAWFHGWQLHLARGWGWGLLDG